MELPFFAFSFPISYSGFQKPEKVVTKISQEMLAENCELRAHHFAVDRHTGCAMEAEHQDARNIHSSKAAARVAEEICKASRITTDGGVNISEGRQS
jgi:hypothetical protein